MNLIDAASAEFPKAGRILALGCSGDGKSTLSQKLSALLARLETSV